MEMNEEAVHAGGFLPDWLKPIGIDKYLLSFELSHDYIDTYQ